MEFLEPRSLPDGESVVRIGGTVEPPDLLAVYRQVVLPERHWWVLFVKALYGK